MPNIDKKTLATLAVYEHHHHWLANDGHYFLTVNENGNILDVNIAHKIAKDYSVIRNIGGVTELEKLISKINNSDWPDGLSDRFQICQNIAIEFRDIPGRVHAPISGVTKLIWFCRPKGWTMYDKYACIGLLGKKREAKYFYKTLEENKFQEKAQKLTEICIKYGFPYLWGERIIDKFLLFRGLFFEYSLDLKAIKLAHKHQLQLLPYALSSSLKQLAGNLSKEWSDDFIPKPKGFVS